MLYLAIYFIYAIYFKSDAVLQANLEGPVTISWWSAKSVFAQVERVHSTYAFVLPGDCIWVPWPFFAFCIQAPEFVPSQVVVVPVQLVTMMPWSPPYEEIASESLGPSLPFASRRRSLCLAKLSWCRCNLWQWCPDLLHTRRLHLSPLALLWCLLAGGVWVCKPGNRKGSFNGKQ